ncbi:MAG: DUF4258 domain-containing protein [Planctomycetes bacterium]|nr:DUF4258 domain-containing protein [Planctomycetota bacterium]
MKKLVFSQHALDQISDRGTSEKEITKAIRSGEKTEARKGRFAFRKNFIYNSEWKGKYYTTKQVMPVVVEEEGAYIVVTVYVFFFGGTK